MENNMDNDVKDILALLNQGTHTEKSEPKITEKKNSPKKSVTSTTETTPSVKVEKKAVGRALSKSTFLADIEEPTDKTIYNSKVLIREEIYEIFMSLKRLKKFKSVSTLIDSALEEYIRNNRDDIKKTLYDDTKHDIL